MILRRLLKVFFFFVTKDIFDTSRLPIDDEGEKIKHDICSPLHRLLFLFSSSHSLSHHSNSSCIIFLFVSSRNATSVRFSRFLSCFASLSSFFYSAFNTHAFTHKHTNQLMEFAQALYYFIIFFFFFVSFLVFLVFSVNHLLVSRSFVFVFSFFCLFFKH